MTVGVFETIALSAIWLTTMICLTVSYTRDLLRRRRQRFDRRLAALGAAVTRARGN